VMSKCRLMDQGDHEFRTGGFSRLRGQMENIKVKDARHEDGGTKRPLETELWLVRYVHRVGYRHTVVDR
jgi:hypothetical protein